MINFKQFLANYKAMGMREAFNYEIQKTIIQEKEKNKERKEKRDQHSECFERDREKEQGNGEKDLQNNTN